jgi:hypothetical protein
VPHDLDPHQESEICFVAAGEDVLVGDWRVGEASTERGWRRRPVGTRPYHLAVFHSTSHGYTTWYLMLPKAHLTLDGKPSGGYLHKTSDGKTIVLTRTDTERHESYWIILTRHPGANQGRVAPHLPLAAVKGYCAFFGMPCSRA